MSDTGKFKVVGTGHGNLGDGTGNGAGDGKTGDNNGNQHNGGRRNRSYRIKANESKRQNEVWFAILASFVLVNAGWAYEPGKFPGKGSREAWNRAATPMNEGIDLASAGKWDAAIQKYQQAIAIYPYNDGTHLSLGVAFQKRAKPGDFAKAEIACRKATELCPTDWRNWKGLAGSLGLLEHYKESKDAALKALECSPPPDKAAAIKASIDEIDKYLLTHK